MAQYSRKELLEWINDFFQVNITSVQHLGTGAMYVQILDSLYPGQSDMDKVDWMAENQYDSLKNLKVLQAVLSRFNIHPPPTDFEALAKGNITENLEFLRFLKDFWDSHYLTESYDPVARRDECMTIKRKKSTEKQFERMPSNRRSASRASPQAPSAQTRGRPRVDVNSLPPAILQEYREIFQELDMNRKGRISWQELLLTLGMGQRSEDSNGDRLLDFSEFVQIMIDPQTDLNSILPIPMQNGISNNSNARNSGGPTRTLSTAPAPIPQALSPVAAKNPANNNINNMLISGNGNATAAASVLAQPNGSPNVRKSVEASANNAAAIAEISGLQAQLDEEAQISHELEGERDFYYDKLCEVEMLCQDAQYATPDPQLVQAILEILWRPRE